MHTYAELPRGASTTIQLHYTVPVDDGRYRLRLLPQPLADDADLRLTVTPAAGLTMSRLDGADVEEGAVSRSGPWSQSELVDVVVR